MIKLNKITLLIVVLLAFGFIYKLLVTSNNNFLFNMDNGRDMIDVREIVVLHKVRLIGPTSGIQGFYNGPGWYYLLAIPFVLTGGNPYSEVVLMIVLWCIGGFFLLKLTSRFGLNIVAVIGLLWISSNYVGLSTVYAFNPNPVILTTPLLIFILEKYLKKGELAASFGIWILAGLYFNFEMAAGIFIPLIILLSILITGNVKYLKTRNFWIGTFIFILFLLPQIFFNFRHGSILTNSIVSYSQSGTAPYGSLMERYQATLDLYQGVLSGTLMNWNLLTKFFVLLIIGLIILSVKKFKKTDELLVISLLMVIVPFLGAIVLPIHIMPWHLGAAMAASILILGIGLNYLKQINKMIEILIIVVGLIILVFSINNLELVKNLASPHQSMDPSSFQNEEAAVDYTYKVASGKNFRTYVYIPSVIDYTYQYIFWWYGQRKYGYLPKDYAYQPNKPPYISNKEKFSNGVNPPDSGLTFLIKDPNRPDLEDLWKNSFTSLSLVNSAKIGPLTVETRK